MFKSYSESKERDANLATMIQSLALAENDWERAGLIADKSVPWIRSKAAIGGSESSNLYGSFQHLMEGAFLLSLADGPSAFDQIRPFTKREKFNVPLFLGGALQAKVVAESAAVPVTKYSVTSNSLTPVKVAAIAIETNEAMKSEEGAEAVRQELTAAVSTATDAKFLADLIAVAGLSQAATASPLAVADLLALLTAVNLSGRGPLFWICSPAVANLLTVFKVVGDAPPLFPAMSPTGGELLGLPCLVSTGILSTSMILVDPSAILTASTELELKVTTEAMVSMDDAPTMDSQIPTGANMVSLFQCECTGILALRSFAAKLLRTSGVATLTGIGWA